MIRCLHRLCKTLALLCALAALAAQAAPPLQGKDWLLLKYEASDPLNQALWAGDPQRLLAALPPSVGVLVFPAGEAISASKVPGPWTQAQRLGNSGELPATIAQALDTYGHDLRSVRTSPPVTAPFVAVGDSGIGKVLANKESVSLPLAYWGNDACQQQGPQGEVRGRAVLIRRGGCPYVEKLQAALRAGAGAVLIVNNEQPLNRDAGACADCKQLYLAALPQSAGEALIAAVQSWPAPPQQPLRLHLQGARAQASALRIGSDGSVQEAGYIPYPFNPMLDQPLDPFFQLALEAVDLQYQSQLRARLQTEVQSQGVRALPVFAGMLAQDPSWSGQRISAVLALPEDFATASRLWWDLALQCEGHLKSQCPPWDYISTMYLCQDAQAARCEDEVGRWITPYWSGGRWVHDISPLLGRLRRAAHHAPRDAQGRALVRFEFHSIAPYRVLASLRYASSGSALAAPQGLIPLDAQRLPFAGGAMHDGQFAQRQEVATVQVPAGVRSVQLAALLSGHGFADDDKCAEFCNTVHHFEVEGAGIHRLDQAHAGSELGCLEQVGAGVVPNQGGTWVYGRNGWCPGDAVALRLLDLSADLALLRQGMGTADNEPAPAVRLRLRYWATVNGKDHAPGLSAQGRQSDARLDVTAYLVFYGLP